MLASSFSPRIWVFSLESKELIKLRSFLLFSLAENFLLIMNISWILLNKFCRTHWKDHMVFSGLEPRVSISKLFLCCWKKKFPTWPWYIVKRSCYILFADISFKTFVHKYNLNITFLHHPLYFTVLPLSDFHF